MPDNFKCKGQAKEDLMFSLISARAVDYHV